MKLPLRKVDYRWGKGLTIALATLIVAIGLWIARPALAVDGTDVHAVDGVQVFNVHCAGCHINGGNIVRRGKNLKLKALQRNHVDSIEAIAAIVTNGKGIMASYSDRLTPQEIQDVAAYVWGQAEQGWK